MTHSILFSGHMIDGPDRTLTPRFPAANEQRVKADITAQLVEELAQREQLQGIASGACGGDILFLEACLELGIPATLYLPMTPAVFKQKSVSFAGQQWDQRFDRLLSMLPVVMQEQQTKEQRKTNVFQQLNIRMLQDALANGSEHMTLMLLWNEVRNVGSAGPARVIEEAARYDVYTRIIRPY
jgi:hypothetical protein